MTADMKAAAEVLKHLFWTEVAEAHPTNPMTDEDWLRCATSIVNAAVTPRVKPVKKQSKPLCSSKTDYDGILYVYCQRPKGHPGPHVVYPSERIEWPNRALKSDGSRP